MRARLFDCYVRKKFKTMSFEYIIRCQRHRVVVAFSLCLLSGEGERERARKKKGLKLCLLLTSSYFCIWKSTKFSSTEILPVRHHWLLVFVAAFFLVVLDIPFAHFAVAGRLNGWHTIHLLLHTRSRRGHAIHANICNMLYFKVNVYMTLFPQFSHIHTSFGHLIHSLLHIFYYGAIASCIDNAFANQFRTQCGTHTHMRCLCSHC